MVERGVMIIHKRIGWKEVVCGMYGDLMYVVGMTANNFSISSPDDVLSMDIAGMDAGIMTAIEKFIAM